MASSEIPIKKIAMIGHGSYKNAFAIGENENPSPHNFTIPVGSNVEDFCLVEYSKPIAWRHESTFSEDFKQFVNALKTKPELNYNISKTPYERMIHKLQINIDLYDEYDDISDQLNCISELKKMRELSPRFAPSIRQIRTDILDRHGALLQYGNPFSPEDMDSGFGRIQTQGTGIKFIRVSYLIERCGDNIIKYVSTHGPAEKTKVETKMIEFVDSYVDTFCEVNVDIKSPNFCTKIIDGEIESIRLLDVDPTYCIKCGSDDPEEFKKHAKVFMKYAFIAHSVRWGEIINKTPTKVLFGNLGVTQDDVMEMIEYFCTRKYFMYERNPINMLYHYFIYINPAKLVTGHEHEPHQYRFLKYDKIEEYYGGYTLDSLKFIFNGYAKNYGIVFGSAATVPTPGGGGYAEQPPAPPPTRIGGKRKTRRHKKK